MPKRFSFKGGVFLPNHNYQTAQLAVEEFPAPSRVTIPLLQHRGTIAQPKVKRGDHVTVGQLIAEPDNPNSLAVHSSVSGEVTVIGLFPHPSGKQTLGIEIENDGKDDKANIQPFNKPWRDAAPGELIQKIEACGIAGVGEDGLATHLKLSIPSNRTIDTLIINGCEGEPYLGAVDRTIIEKTENLLTGVLMAKKILGAASAVIGIDEKKVSAIQALTSWLADSRFKEVSIVYLKSKHPLGNERPFVNAITGKSFSSNSSSIDIGCVVLNVATIIAIHDAIIDGTPVYQRIISVCGPTVRKPGNFLVRIGTPIGDILNNCEVEMKSTKKILMGGPMMGLAQTDLDAPIIKTTTGLFAYDKTTPALHSYPCINCGKCVAACPIHLIPSQIVKYIEKNKFDKATDWNVMECIECGSCAYVCPAKINLVHYIKLGKYNIQNAKKMERALQNSKGNSTK